MKKAEKADSPKQERSWKEKYSGIAGRGPHVFPHQERDRPPWDIRAVLSSAERNRRAAFGPPDLGQIEALAWETA